MCATCGRRIGRHGWRFCSRRCQGRARQVAVDPLLVVRALNTGRPWECVATDLAVSRATLYRVCQRAGIVRVAGPRHRPGQYSLVDRRDPRQLRWC